MKENTSFNSKRLAQRLRIEYLAGLLIAGVTILLAELSIVPLEGCLVGNPNAMYTLEVVCILLTIALVPGALKGYHWALSHQIARSNGEKRLQRYIQWNELRQWALWLVMEVSIQLYYATLENTGMFCALIALVSTLYCWPGKDGLKEEWQSLPQDDIENK